MTTLDDDLKALGNSDGTKYDYDEIATTVLERFENPAWIDQSRPESQEIGRESTSRNPVGVAASVHIECPEFTSLCPITGQPDFAKIIIDYTPREWCVESKSLKLYMFSYRNIGEFHESCVVRMANDLVLLLDPYAIQVTGEFTPRGGIPIWPTIIWQHPDLQEQQRSGLILPPSAR